jgi:acetyl esterase/lipase
VVLIHGGFWRAHRTLDLMRPLAWSLADAGFAAWNLEYRAVGHDGGGWPGTLTDVAAGIDALADIARDHPLDLDRVALVGHSAGGQLALWAAGDRMLADAAASPAARVRPVLVVSLAGVCDLERGAASDLGEGAVRGFVGGEPDAVRERYRSVSPAAIVPLGVPQVLVHGDADRKVPPDQSRAYAEVAHAAGDPVDVVVVPGSDHMALVDPGSEAWRATLSRLTPMLRPRTHLDPADRVSATADGPGRNA